MTDLVTPGTPGRNVFFSQRVLEGKPPYIDCRIVGFMGCLVFGGLAIPNPRALMQALRAATGRPEGLNAGDIVHAAATLLPWVPVNAAATADADLLQALLLGDATATVSVTYGLLPVRLRRWSPTFRNGHEIRLAGARRVNGAWQVLWMDPLGYGSYRGEWVAWSAVRQAMWGDGGHVIATSIERGAALSTAITPQRLFAPPAAVSVPKGTQVFTFDAATLNLHTPGAVTSAPITTTTDGVFGIAQVPARPPSGPFVRLADGRYVREDAVTITPVPPPALDCTAAVDAATAPLKDTIAKVAAAVAGYGS